MELQQQLEDQFFVRNALEKELIKEISALELEVVYLERYLVSLYKQKYGYYDKAESPEAMKVKRVSQTRNNVEAGTKELPQAENLLQCSSSSSSIRRCYSSAAAISRALDSHHSLPLSLFEAYLEYGIPRNHIRRMSLVLKAAYNVGGRAVSVDMIQTSILGCHLPRPAQQWLGVLLYPRRKLKTGDSKRSYSITTPEPRLYFALCTGNHSDPPLRVYGPETVFEDLEAAKQDYIQASLNLHRQKNNKVMLPKIVDCFAKDSQLCPAALVETELDHLLPASVTNSIRRRMHNNKPICWVPHSFDFRYLISRESMEDIIQPNSFPGSCSIQNS
ncbi:unnamed protein product [Linum tenue]|uniref:DUF547 domain-containing protein n=1 Tax=Linum tenue TaxID=586396 RepID=A0AAV0LV81_9ROSI|nr:unnamed protein product [Linum tenue]